MDLLISKFYDGYEGEPEIRFIKGSDNGSRTIISVWDGFFDDIMRQFKPTATGWQGLAYYYHLLIGWEDDETWEIPNLNLVLEELRNLEPSRLEFGGSASVLSILCDAY